MDNLRNVFTFSILIIFFPLLSHHVCFYSLGIEWLCRYVTWKLFWVINFHLFIQWKWIIFLDNQVSKNFSPKYLDTFINGTMKYSNIFVSLSLSICLLFFGLNYHQYLFYIPTETKLLCLQLRMKLIQIDLSSIWLIFLIPSLLLQWNNWNLLIKSIS